jgi:AraC-like DNA-binding protein
MRHEASTEKLFVRIERDALQRLAEQLLPGGPRTGVTFVPALPLTAPPLASLRAMLDWLFHEASQGPLLDQSLLVARIEETLLLSILQFVPHNRPDLLRSGPMIAPGFVIRAEDYMASHAHEALTVAQIAALVGVSIRSLFAAFQRYRGNSPMEHLRTVRMERAHLDLSRVGDENTSVTKVALRWGFGHLGQFAADYKRRFGELPSQSLRRARGR